MIINSEDIQRITRQLQDDISKTIYANLLLFATTNESGFLRNVCMTIPETQKFMNWLEIHSDQKKVLFGAGKWGNWIKDTFDNVHWDYFVDNYASDKYYINGLPVISVDLLRSEHKEACIVVTSKYHWKEIAAQLYNEGFSVNQVYLLGKDIAEIESRIYFDLPALPKSNYEVFADVGGYDGASSLSFCQWAEGNYKVKIFEPNVESQEKCKEKLAGYTGIEIIPKGLWNEEKTLKFLLNDSESKIIDKVGKGINVIPVTTLDKAFNGEPVTFIKMDIEGSEYNALLGAKNTIIQYKPKLAISVYHKPEDIIEIPKLLLEYNPEYKFWLRHYSMTWFDSILYAI